MKNLLLLFLAVTVHARDQWFRHFHLEPTVARADLVLIVRVAEVSETKIIQAGKGESTLVQFPFTPARTLPGVVRDARLEGYPSSPGPRSICASTGSPSA